MGMRVLQLLLITLTALTGCTKKSDSLSTSPKTDTVKTVTMPNSTLTYLALGDSYTIGQSVIQNGSFPYQLVNLLNSQGKLDVNYPVILATTGWTTDNLIYAISTSNITHNKYDMVTLLIGVNDQYQGLTPDHYHANFVTLLHTAINFAGGDSTRVFVLSIPDYGVTPFAQGQDNIIGPQIDQFNAINKAESLKAGVNYLDITPISRQAATDTSLIAPDGLHPSAKMYTLWVQLLGPMVEKRLKK
jgi:lysophospholipase L1-like esterase